MGKMWLPREEMCVQPLGREDPLEKETNLGIVLKISPSNL